MYSTFASNFAAIKTYVIIISYIKSKMRLTNFSSMVLLEILQLYIMCMHDYIECCKRLYVYLKTWLPDPNVCCGENPSLFHAVS